MSPVNDLAAALRGAAEAAARAAGEHVLDVAKANVAVDTGELKDSGTVKASGNQATISFDAEHATSVHENHRGVSTSPKFLERAMVEEKSKVQRIVADEVRKALGG